MKRRVYDEEFKQAAIARMKKEPVAAIAADLKVSDSMLYSWKAKKKGYKKGKVKNVAHFRKLVNKAEGKSAGVHDAIVYLRKARAIEEPHLQVALGQLALAALEGKL